MRHPMGGNEEIEMLKKKLAKSGINL